MPPTTWTPRIDPLLMLLINAGRGGVKTSRGAIFSKSRRMSSLPSHLCVRGLYVIFPWTVVSFIGIQGTFGFMRGIQVFD